MITIKEIKSKKEMRAFVKFPFSLYKNNKYWIPPIINDEIDGFDKNINPAFNHAQAQFFLAYQNNQIVGRVAAIINWTEVKKQKIKKMRFGWFDMIDDIEVTKVLIDKVKEIGKAHNLDFIEGPVGFSNLDKVGILTKGYDEIGTMITWYNHPYYVSHLEQLGFKKAKEWLENYIMFENIDPNKFTRLSMIIAKRYELRSINFDKTKNLMPYINEMFDLFNSSYADLSSFVPISEEEKAYFKKKYISLIDPEFIKFVVDKNDKLVAFAITMPSFSKALQKANGKLFPFGIFHLLKARRTNDEGIFYLIGVDPEYQNKGVTAMIFDEYYKTYLKRGTKKLFRTPELEDNIAIRQIWKDFKPVNHKRRRTYRLEID